jgi:hypothetical protein
MIRSSAMRVILGVGVTMGAGSIPSWAGVTFTYSHQSVGANVGLQLCSFPGGPPVGGQDGKYVEGVGPFASAASAGGTTVEGSYGQVQAETVSLVSAGTISMNATATGEWGITCFPGTFLSGGAGLTASFFVDGALPFAVSGELETTGSGSGALLWLFKLDPPPFPGGPPMQTTIFGWMNPVFGTAKVPVIKSGVLAPGQYEIYASPGVGFDGTPSASGSAKVNFVLTLGAPPPPPPTPGDVDGDGNVDQSDLGTLLADWGCVGTNCAGDLDGDGDTDQSDLGILLAHYGQGV